MQGSASDILIQTAFCAYAIFAVCIALSGYWQQTVSMPRKVLLVAIAGVILWPTSFVVNAAGVVGLTILLFPDMRMSLKNLGRGD
jgi:TRAP-type uncharacterized transport system fused permease subunit